MVSGTCYRYAHEPLLRSGGVCDCCALERNGACGSLFKYGSSRPPLLYGARVCSAFASTYYVTGFMCICDWFFCHISVYGISRSLLFAEVCHSPFVLRRVESVCGDYIIFERERCLVASQQCLYPYVWFGFECFLQRPPFMCVSRTV